MKLSVIIPARDEEGSIEKTVAGVASALRTAVIPYEIVVVDDGSADRTVDAARRAADRDDNVILVSNTGDHGFGFAVRTGLRRSTGDAVAVMMADNSDSPSDLVAYYKKVLEGYECVYVSRLIRGGSVTDYPGHKLVLNRLAKWFIKAMVRLKCNDITNEF